MTEIQGPGFCWTGGHVNDDIRKRGVGEGWHPLLDELHEDLMAADPEYQAVQVKEKFGLLRVYIRAHGESHPAADVIIPGEGVLHADSMGETGDAWKSAMAIVHVYEARSGEICETCGAPGVLREGGWWRTLCDFHEEKYQESRLNRWRK